FHLELLKTPLEVCNDTDLIYLVILRSALRTPSNPLIAGNSISYILSMKAAVFFCSSQFIPTLFSEFPPTYVSNVQLFPIGLALGFIRLKLDPFFLVGPCLQNNIHVSNTPQNLFGQRSFFHADGWNIFPILDKGDVSITFNHFYFGPRARTMHPLINCQLLHMK